MTAGMTVFQAEMKRELPGFCIVLYFVYLKRSGMVQVQCLQIELDIYSLTGLK